MEEEKKKDPEKKKYGNELDRELDQTFPASDPPSHTRPGQDHSDEEGKKGKE
jgi:hypothetical protein